MQVFSLITNYLLVYHSSSERFSYTRRVLQSTVKNVGRECSFKYDYDKSWNGFHLRH